MNLRRSIHVTLLVCILGALAALARVSVYGWETILTHEMPGYQVSAESIVLDPSDEWAAQRLFVGTVAIPVQEEVDQHPPGKLFIIDSSTGMHQEASLARTRRTKVLGFSQTSGALFAYISSSSDESPNEIFRSFDRGASWTTVDTVPTDFLQAFTGDDEGRLFTAGNRWTLTNGLWRFLGAFVRKSIDDGHTWNTVEAPNGTEYRVLHFVPGANGGLFVGGNRPSPTYGWIVRRSRDSGATWTTVLSTTTHDYVQAMTSDTHGNLYVCGAVGGAPIRMSRDGGETWQSLRVPSAVGVTSAAAMLTDAAGNLYVLVGISVQAGLSMSSTVLRRNLEGNWEDLGPNADNTLGSMALGPAGHLYVGGGYFTVFPERALIVMRLALNPAGLPPLEITRSGGAVKVSWPTVDGVQLESANALDGERQWEHVPVIPATEAGKSSVSIENDSPTRYFRLSKP